MKTSIATVSLSGDLKDKLGAIAKAGFDGVEIFENDFLVFDESPRQVGRMVRDHGLEITLFQPFRDFEGMPEPLRGRTFDRAERKFDLMQEMGTDLVLVCSNVSSAAIGGLDRAAADFHELGERAARRGLKVGYEALAWGRHINDHRDAWEIVRRADHPNVGLILDSFHTLSRRIDVNSIRSIPKEKIFIIQLADAPLIDMDLLYWSRHFRNMPGEGDLPVLDFMKAVAATGYDGYLSLEIFNDQFRGGNANAIAVDGRRSLVYLGDQVRRAEPDSALAVPAMPDRAEVQGIEFIEFATSEDETESLVALLHSLGFSLSGRHKSKRVSRYSQGGINILVNADEEGFVYSSYAMHGTSAYAIALKVADAGRAFERALTLEAQSFEQDVPSGELNIPAIRGIGGGLIYLVDDVSELSRIWDVDFLPEAEATSPQEAGLTAIDHLAQTMNSEEMLTAILFYTSIFRMRKTPVIDVIDPAGIVRSQVVENETGTLRITLNGASNRRTLAGHFLAENFGPSVQHVAFATGDIFATASALRANGFRALPISANYYDDVETRFGLASDFVDRMKAENILYDRDEHGEFFQLYSPNYGEGFFFEIVERRSYSGYGSNNAIFRIASQKRQIRPDGLPAAS
ncbi:sugar phosphate isomerase/epimerase and 4-hydroxyphenylpyruvate domain-containing protein [Rhizobium herbae]|uniref:3-dehydroshikimate dehydratase n=1 Tax=Rhizobium herbae TaxID=508661 RepID=A0ABS7HC04_9HYPH|nr:sugar phosphate isomerase/epimerase and 4-hydroxyphenylpyruvate domain-containing protein [Rhizobium herbae]MBW9064794.1 sugar phosphate isomerase/epimerase and 4-hydroxyphenylpyruvate domain-containing protein [Rhizobium herbae]